MFDSVKDFFNRNDQHKAEKSSLESEAKDFRIPSEVLPQIFKYLFFVGLGFLNYRLFAHTVPGLWGQATGIVAVLSEAVALYGSHNFSRSSGWFRLSLGVSFGLLMLFSMVHGTFSIFDLLGAASVSDAVREYSRFVAFPLLAGLVGVSVVAICMTHPKNIVRLKQAEAHTNVVTGRAEIASEMALQKARSVAEQARLERIQEQNRITEAYLPEVSRVIHANQKLLEMIAAIPIASLRDSIAREHGIDPASLPPVKKPLVKWQGHQATDAQGNPVSVNDLLN